MLAFQCLPTGKYSWGWLVCHQFCRFCKYLVITKYHSLKYWTNLNFDITIHLEENMNGCTKVHVNPSNGPNVNLMVCWWQRKGWGITKITSTIYPMVAEIQYFSVDQNGVLTNVNIHRAMPLACLSLHTCHI